MEVLSLLFGCYTNRQSLYMQILSDLIDFSFCGNKIKCQIQLLQDQDTHINNIFAHCSEKLDALEVRGRIRDSYRFLFVLCKQIAYVSEGESDGDVIG